MDAVNTKAAFFNKINRLGPGPRALLSRCAGMSITHAPTTALCVFYECLPEGVSKKDEEFYFAAACFRCMWNTGREGTAPLESIFKKLYQDKSITKSMNKRVADLLDERWADDGYVLVRLANLIRMVRQKLPGVRPDFGALIDDLRWWNSDDQRVQRKWARSVFVKVELEPDTANA